MTKRIISLLLITLLITLSFSGCLGKTKADKSFAVPITDEPSSLDPQIVNSDAEKLIVSNCFEGLMRISESGELENGVCKNYTVSDDGLKYTFILRDDAHWALFSGHKTILGENYKETFDINVYAQDFKFAFDRLFNISINSPYTYLFDAVQSYEAVDNHTFTVTLKHKDDNFLYSLTCPGAMPCDEEFYNATGGKYGLDAKYLLCNGPFNVSKWVENTTVKIVRNDDYNGEHKVKPSSVTFYLNKDASAIAGKMSADTYDAAFLSKSQFNNITDFEDLNISEVSNTVYSIIFNQKDKYLQNKNIRQAIAYATDLSIVSSDNAIAASGIIPPFCKIGNESYVTENNSAELLPYDAESAKKCFEQGLLETGSSSVEIEIKCTEEYETFVKQLIQIMQKTLGVKFIVSATVLSENELSAAISDGNYSAAFYPFTANSVMTSDFLESFAGQNIFSYSSVSFTKSIDAIRTNSGDFTALRKCCEDAENIIISDVVMIPVLFENSYFLTSKDTQGIYFYSSSDSIYFINATKK